MGNEMFGVIYNGEGKLKIGNVPKPEIEKENDVVIKVEAASICGTDIQILKVPPGHPANTGIILGHEYVGKVIEKGVGARSVDIGDRVAVEPCITCGHCRFCRAGLPDMCLNSTTIGIYKNGGFAEYSCIPESAAHKVDCGLSPEIAVFAEPLSCIVNALGRLKPDPGDISLVLGAGPIGLLFFKMLKASGAGKVFISEISPYRRKIAEKCGATCVIDPSTDDPEKVVGEYTDIGVDNVIDCVGSLLDQAIRCVRKRGKVLTFGLNSAAQNSIKPYDITHKSIDVIGSFIASFTFPTAIKILESGIIDVKELITHRYKKEEFEKGLEVMRSGAAIKVVIDFQS